MGLQSLLLCRDPAILRIFRRALDELGVGIEVCTAAESALERLERNKFDSVIVDCDDVAGGQDVLIAIQKAPSNKRAIVLALISGTTTMRSAFEMGAHFALDKPVTMERATRAFRAAHGFMVAEQRRYFRHAVEGQAWLTFGAVKQLACKVTNISDGGMAVALTEPFAPGASVEVRFELPGLLERMEAKGECAWSDGKGNAGIRFVHVPNDGKRALARWLAERASDDMPARGVVGGAAGANGRRPASV
jgi:ActR/RegA family two-component response regulator